MDKDIKWIIEIRDYMFEKDCFRLEFTDEDKFKEYMNKFLDEGYEVTAYVEC